MNPRLLLIAPLLTCFAAAAQTAATVPVAQESRALDPRKNQKVERIRIEDDGARIEEVRYGGQTQSITVQPKTRIGLPEYEIQPTDMGRARPGDNRDGMSSANGRRVWNVFQF